MQCIMFMLNPLDIGSTDRGKVPVEVTSLWNLP